MSYIDFDEKTWREFQGERATILRETRMYTTDPKMLEALDRTIGAIEREMDDSVRRRWWQFWKA